MNWSNHFIKNSCYISVQNLTKRTKTTFVEFYVRCSVILLKRVLKEKYMKKKISLDVFNFTFWIHYDKESIEKATERPIEEPFITRCMSDEVHVYVENAWDDVTNPKFLQCLSHECNHAAMHILGSIGVNFDFYNQEALCYTQDLLFRRSYEYALEAFPQK